MPAMPMPNTTVAYYLENELPAEYRDAINKAKTDNDYYPDNEHPLVMLFGDDLASYATDIAAKFLDPYTTITNLALPVLDYGDEPTRAVAIVYHNNGYLIIDLKP